jgi:hypothetical protein
VPSPPNIWMVTFASVPALRGSCTQWVSLEPIPRFVNDRRENHHVRKLPVSDFALSFNKPLELTIQPNHPLHGAGGRVRLYSEPVLTYRAPVS